MTLPRAQPLTVAEVHDAHASFVWQSLQRLGVREADLADMVQEVFLVVHRKLGEFEGNARMTTWLFAISMRVASAYRNRAWVRREVMAPEQQFEAAASVALNQEEALAAHQARARLDMVLDAMDLEKRALFVMFEIDELSCEEIAEVTGVPVGTVYSRLHAARKAFRAALARASAADNRRRQPA